MYTFLAVLAAAVAGFALIRPLSLADAGDDEIQPLLALAAAGEAESVEPAARPAEKETIYATLAELEYDYATNKLSMEDYEGLKADLETQALTLIRREEAVEAEVLAELQGAGALGEVAYCPDCGARLLRGGQRFCDRCGVRLPAAKTAAPAGSED